MRRKKITLEWCFHYQVSCFPGNMKFFWCDCSWIALPCPEIPPWSCWGSKCCPEAMGTIAVGTDLDWEAKGRVGAAVGGLLFFIIFPVMSPDLPNFLPARSVILSLLSSRSLPVRLCHRTHVWMCGKMLCQQVGRGTTNAIHCAGWSPKELASSAFPNTIFKCQSCIKAYPAMESQWHGSD